MLWSSTYFVTCSRPELLRRLSTACGPTRLPTVGVQRTEAGFSFLVLHQPVCTVDIEVSMESVPLLRLRTTTASRVRGLLLLLLPPQLLALGAGAMGTLAMMRSPLSPIPAYLPATLPPLASLVVLALAAVCFDHWKSTTLRRLGARPEPSRSRTSTDEDPASSWDELSAAHFLTYQETGRQRVLMGSVNGLVVDVRGRAPTLYEPNQMRTEISVRVPNLPHRLYLHAGSGGTPLGDPILDGRVVVHGDPQILLAWSRLPAMDDLRGVLLEALDRWPELRIEHGRLWYATPVALGARLVQCVEELVELGKALNSLALPLQPDGPDASLGTEGRGQ